MSTALRPAGKADTARTPAASFSGAVAFYLPSLCGGGAERVIVNLAEGMIERGSRSTWSWPAAEGELLDRLPAGSASGGPSVPGE